ncbi:ABC transporter permease subunit, partial [Burkholderia sp. SIMBA_043]|uniref:ABC transporter permease subunit n=1 Tax=Burkholderia sp. SIMBA_043 TaxID=3085784 RepID=UPI00397AD03E
NMLLLVPNSLREAAAALGCPKWRMITLVCYRAAKTGIITGVLLAILCRSGITLLVLACLLLWQRQALGLPAGTRHWQLLLGL